MPAELGFQSLRVPNCRSLAVLRSAILYCCCCNAKDLVLSIRVQASERSAPGNLLWGRRQGTQSNMARHTALNNPRWVAHRAGRQPASSSAASLRRAPKSCLV